MPVLTDAALAYIRSEVGPDVTENDIAERFDRLGSATDVALEIVRARIATVLSGPGSYAVTGVYSEDNTPVIRGLQAQLQRLAKQKMDERDGSAELVNDEVIRHTLRPRRKR